MLWKPDDKRRHITLDNLFSDQFMHGHSIRIGTMAHDIRVLADVNPDPESQSDIFVNYRGYEVCSQMT